jgi:putative GTP pyrophosphokinase
MDFWASLEHKIYYKFEGNAPEYISRDLRECSSIVSMLDAKMLSLNEAILQAKKDQGDPVPEAWEPSGKPPVEEDEADLLNQFARRG